MLKVNKKLKRKTRVRIRLKGAETKPRLSVFRSNRYLYAQLINDSKHRTVLGISEKELEKSTKTTKTEKAKTLGLLLAKKALEKKISFVVFDRGPYSFHGRVKAFAQGAREGGLKF